MYVFYLFNFCIALHCGRYECTREYAHGMIDWMVYRDIEIIFQVLRTDKQSNQTNSKAKNEAKQMGIINR